MPFALVTIGLIMVITGVRNTHAEFGKALRADFTGDKSFLWWLASLGVVGAVGYIKELRSFSHWFMALIILSMLLANKGFFDRLREAIEQGPISPTPAKSAAEDGSKDTMKTAVDIGKTVLPALV